MNKLKDAWENKDILLYLMEVTVAKSCGYRFMWSKSGKADGGSSALDNEWRFKNRIHVTVNYMFLLLWFNYMSTAQGVIKYKILASRQHRIKKREECFVSSRGGGVFKNSKHEGGKSKPCERWSAFLWLPWLI